MKLTINHDYLIDPNLSLKEKLRLHTEHKRRTGINENAVFMNRWGPPVLLFTLAGCAGWGMAYALPALYVDEWEGWVFPLRAFVAFAIVELSLNWWLARHVSSEYRPDLHGTKPPDFPADRQDFASPEASNSLLTVAKEMEKNGGGASLLQSSNERSAAHDVKLGKRNISLGEPSSTASSSSSSTTTDAGSGAPSGEAIDLDYAPPKPARKIGSYDGFSYRMMVATSLPTADGEVERKPYPYWSWAPCLMCQKLRPPRCHHCTLCKHCVLKRDHHCYLTGVCIGVNNMRFLLGFLFWAILLTAFGTCHMLPYTFGHVVPDYHMSYFDFFLPVSLVRGLLGYVSLVVFLLCLLFWLLLLFTLFSVTMFISMLHLVVKGKTGFERDHSIKVSDTRSLAGRLLSVFGSHWWVNFLVPTYPWVRPVEDAVLWHDIKPF